MSWTDFGASVPPQLEAQTSWFPAEVLTQGTPEPEIEAPAVEKTEEELWREELEKEMNPRKNRIIKFCIDNREAILALHSSENETPVFKMGCAGCDRWYKHCMFSIRQRKVDHPLCRWCMLENGIGNTINEFEIHGHIHCNRGGKKECGEHGLLSLVRLEPKAKPVKPVMEGNGLADLASPDVPITFTKGGKKIGQKERKRLARTGA